ncbi:MAG: beta-1,6-N-acetylglucosaminyltransferase [Bacilli bacterium]
MKKDAILILCHDNFEQIRYFIQRTDFQYFDFYIHIDLKSNVFIDSFLKEFNNVYVIKNRVRVAWAKFSIIQATLNLMESATQSGCDYRYFHLMSGHCLPLKNSLELYHAFDGNSSVSREYIDSNSLPWSYWGSCFSQGLDRVRIYYPSFIVKTDPYWSVHYTYLYVRICRKFKLFRTKKKLAKIGPFFAGSEWFSLTQKTILFMLDYLKKHPEFIKFFRNSFISDESFFQTLIEKIPYSWEKMGNARYIDWSAPACNSPNLLTKKDWPAMFDSNHFFARKISMQANELKEFFDLLDEKQLNSNS